MKDFPRGIINGEQGILKKDGIYFYNPSTFVQTNLFCPHWGAEYICEKPYRVDRNELDVFDSFILFYIVKGRMEFRYRGQTFSALTGDIVLLDCKYTNYYWTEKEVRFRYVHFSGNASQAYSDFLYSKQKGYFPNHQELGVQFFNLLRSMQTGNTGEHAVSLQLYTILTALADAEVTRRNMYMHPAVLSAKKYMDQHFADPLSVADLSAIVNLSQYHFSRLFHAEVGASVHSYLRDIRMNHAKKLLYETDLSVEDIALQCGFLSTSHFIGAFKQAMQLTPLGFRRLFR